jgi:hypothetical protein
VEPWTFAVLGKGLSQVGKWLDYAFQAIKLSREAYWEIAQDAYMTGPALLIALLAQILQSLNSERQLDVVNILMRYAIWFFSVLFLYMAARVLRGKADYTTTLRVMGFAQAAHIFELLDFLPVIGPLARFLALLLTFFGVWIGTTTAHELKGWRTFLLPVIYIATIVVTLVFLVAVIEGSAFTVEGLLEDFGLSSGQ